MYKLMRFEAPKVETAMSFLTSASSCFLLALIRLIGGEVTQSTEVPSTSPSANLYSDWKIDTNSTLSLINEIETSQAQNESLNSTSMSIEEIFNSQGLNNVTEKSNFVTTSHSPHRLEKEFHTNATTDNFIEHLTTISLEQNDSFWEGSLVDYDNETKDSNDVQNNTNFKQNDTSRMITDWNGTVGDNSTRTESIMRRTTTYPDTNLIHADDLSTIKRSSLTLTAYDAKQEGETSKDLTEAPKGTTTLSYEASSLYDSKTYEIVKNITSENTSKAVDAKRKALLNVILNNKSSNSGLYMEQKYNNNNSSSITATPSTANSIWLNDQSTSTEKFVQKDLEILNRKEKNARKSYAGSLRDDRTKLANQEIHVKRQLPEEIRKRNGNHRWANKNVEEEISSSKRNKSIEKQVTKSEDLLTSSILKEIKRPRLSFRKIFKDRIQSKAGYLNDDGKIFQEKDETAGESIDANFSSVPWKSNIEKETLNLDARSMWNLLTNRDILPTVLIPQGPWEIPTEPDPVLAEYLIRSALANWRIYHSDLVEPILDEDAHGEIFEIDKFFSILATLNRYGYYENPIYISPNSIDCDFPSTSLKIAAAMKWTLVYRTVEIIPRIICKRTRTMYGKDDPGYEKHCKIRRIVCSRNYLDVQRQTIPLIRDNRLIMTVKNPRVYYRIPGSFPLSTSYKSIKGNIVWLYPQWGIEVRREDEEDTFPFRNPSDLEQVKQVSRKADWVVGAMKEKSSHPDTIGNFIVFDILNFIGSPYSKEVSARQSCAMEMAHSPEVVKEVLLETIRRAIRDNKHETSKQALVHPYLDDTKKPTSSVRSNVDNEIALTDKSITTTPKMHRDFMNVGKYKTDSKENLFGTRQNSGNSNDTTYGSRASLTKSVKNIDNERLKNIRNELIDLIEFPVTDNRKHNFNQSIISNTSDNKHFNSNVNLSTTLDVAKISKINATSLSTEPLVPAIHSNFESIKSQPVSVTNSELKSSKTINTNVIETFGTTDVNAHRSNGSSVTGDSPAEYQDISLSNETFDTAKEIALRVFASLFDSSDTDIRSIPRLTTMFNKKYNLHEDINNQTEHIIDSTQAASSSFKKHFYSSNRDDMRENINGGVNGLDLGLGSAIENPSTSTANDNIVNEERYINAKIKPNQSISMNHNANFNQNIGEARSMSDEPIKIALNTVLGLQTPYRLIPPNEDKASILSLTMNQSSDLRNMSLLNNEYHRNNATSDNKVIDKISENQKTPNIKMSKTTNPLLRKAAANVNWNVPRQVNQNTKAAVNNNGNVNKKTNTKLISSSKKSVGIDVDTIHNTSHGLKTNANSGSNKNMNVHTDMHNKVISNTQQLSAIKTNIASQVNHSLSTNYNFNEKINYNNTLNTNKNKGFKKIEIATKEVSIKNKKKKKKKKKNDRFTWSFDKSFNSHTNHNYNSNVKKYVNYLVKSNVDYNASVTKGKNFIEASREPSVKSIVEQTPLNSVHPVDVVQASRPIIDANVTISGALNSVDDITAATHNGAVHSIQNVVQVSSQRLNQSAMNLGETLGITRTAIRNTDARSVQQQYQQPINTENNTNLNYSFDSNYDSNSNDSKKIEQIKNASALTYKTSSSDIANTLETSTQHKSGWYELWYNSGKGDKNNWTEIWNNRFFKRFLQ